MERISRLTGPIYTLTVSNKTIKKNKKKKQIHYNLLGIINNIAFEKATKLVEMRGDTFFEVMVIK